jgi:hypothetical protein
LFADSSIVNPCDPIGAGQGAADLVLMTVWARASASWECATGGERGDFFKSVEIRTKTSRWEHEDKDGNEWTGAWIEPEPK